MATELQLETLGVLVRLTKERGFPPTVREIAEDMDRKSGSSVHYSLRALRRQGYVTWEPRKPRTIREVVDAH